MGNNKDVSFEKALARLEELVSKLEEGNLPLEESLKLFAEGIELTKKCSRQLEAAEKHINILIEGGDGKPMLQEEDL
ncbi:Exodeoxyribonuclease VII small subunit [Desulfotomaculum arcticum]|uniref:Exodeoxyribonuclease 7 small subunit n=1 Tax=Desulfotruncus arcticus DSM 17038 TaxID=1121424 RepID=A0A1I2MQG2_9FIRM|nr:exodeoxyribonuclease VII small subunit [Desulfotruncus arcticus]SFF93683.1 Exodeoxyribonuclease VII small subunit [Desulfotomaculum arcticum] [Desulfotruncus arcticus DSM 17038]